MKGVRSYSVLVWIAALLWSCNTDKAGYGPANLSSTTLNSAHSEACIPIQISLKDLEDKVNRSLGNSAYKSNRTIDGRTVNVEPNGRIFIEGMGRKVRFVVPVKMQVDVSEKMNLGVVDFEVDFIVHSSVSLNSKWQLFTQSQVTEIVWEKEPILNVLGIPINLKKPVENALGENKELVSNRIDEVVRNQVNLKKHVAKIWRNMQRHHNVLRRQNDSLYFIIKPSEIYYSNHHLDGEKLTVNSRLIASTEIKSWLTESDSQWVELPQLQFEDDECSVFNLSTLAHIRHVDLNKSLNQRIGDYSVKFQGYDVGFDSIWTRTSGDLMWLTCQTNGEFSGTISALLNVLLDTAEKQVRLDIERLDVVEGSVGMEAAEFLLGDVIENYLEEYSGFNYGGWLNQMPRFIQVGVEHGRSGDKWHPEFAKMETKFSAIQMTGQGIHLALEASGSGSVVVEQLK
jgi:hypothetical protein